MFLWIFLACSLVLVQDLAGQHAAEGDEPLHGDFRFDYDFKMMKKLAEIDLSMSDVKKRLCSLEIATGNVPSAFSADQCGKETTECRCSNKVCADGWLRRGGSCYLFGSVDSTFVEAKTYCNQFNSHLVYIETEAERKFIRDHAMTLQVKHHWLGITDERSEGIWQYVPGNSSNAANKVNLFDWFKGEPNEGPLANCAVISGNHNYQWIDDPCGGRFRPLCETD